MRKFIAAVFAVAFAASAAFAQSGQAPTLRIVSEDGNRLPSELMYGNTKVKPLRLRPGTNIPITIDDSDFFVQQHYVDFLSRFPDQSGFAFWQGDIDNCSPKPGCTEVKRIHVSAAFFLAIEFQRSGYLVYKTHKAGFGNLDSQPVPVRRENFMPEMRSILNGIIVNDPNDPNWEAKLNANKDAYLQAFVQRSDFVAKYPTSMTAAEFVDKLFQTALVQPTAGERQAAIDAFGAGGTAGRAAALKSVTAEGTTLHQRLFNEGFVLMQYFGYLKRNPNDLPDRNYDGYLFWLGKLNEFNGDFVRAEMVKAFISSAEYRTRF